MVFVACGLNHKSAPISMREKFAVSPEKNSDILQHLLNLPGVSEAAYLSTCNRTEIYCETEDSDIILPQLADYHQLPQEKLPDYTYIHQGTSGLRHLLRVGSGLDSMMVGEPQILGQLKQAYSTACESGSVGKELRQLFEYLFRITKRIRTNSGIGVNPVSVAYASINMISDIFPCFDDLKVFLIGSGQTASLVASYLKKKGVNEFLVASRNLDNASELAQSIDGQGLAIGDIPDYLYQADIVVTATACPLPFINVGLVERAIEKRGNKPMFLLDLAVPRDIEPQVAQLEHVQLYNVDDLQALVDKSLSQRQFAAEIAEQMIDSELENYIRWHRSLRANDAICDYREQTQQIGQVELQRALKQLNTTKSNEDILQELTHRLVNKFCHTPSLGLQHAAYEGREDLLELASFLFKPPPL